MFGKVAAPERDAEGPQRRPAREVQVPAGRHKANAGKDHTHFKLEEVQIEIRFSMTDPVQLHTKARRQDQCRAKGVQLRRGVGAHCGVPEGARRYHGQTAPGMAQADRNIYLTTML